MTQQDTARDFVKYSFYKVAPEWRRLSPAIRERSKAEFAAVLAEFADRVALSSYRMTATRGDVDFLLWKISPTLEALDELAVRLNHTELAGYLHIPHSYLAMTRRSPYVEQHRHAGQEGATAAMRMVGRKYLFVYPFVKTHEWYQLGPEERQRLMNEHFAIGHRYPEVKISTAYSFGLDDQEFVLGFETDNPGAFLDLVMALRESAARPYTLRDTPIFTGLFQPIRECLEGLG